MTATPPISYRKAWKLWLYAIALAINLGLLASRIQLIVAGGDIDTAAIFSTVLCGALAAFLVWELKKPKPPGAAS